MMKSTAFGVVVVPLLLSFSRTKQTSASLCKNLIVQHGCFRMLLISDANFYKKIERATDTKQLQSCVAAAAQHMGLTNVARETQKEAAVTSNMIPNRQKHNAQPLTASDGKAASGKGGPTAAQKGKGRGDIQQNEPKGRGKSRKGQDVKV